MKITRLSLAILSLIMLGSVTSCRTSEAVSTKSGAQLWGENCQRCHNLPPPDFYSDPQWDVVIDHMRIRANITDAEANKIVEFLKAAN